MRSRFQALSCLLALTCAMGCADPVRVNKEVVRKSHEEVWSKGNLDLVDELYTADFVCHFLVGEEWRGHQGLIEKVSSHRTAFPDWREEVVRLVAEGDLVVAQFVASGTNEGEFADHLPTGRQARIHEVAIYRLENGKIAEQWGFPDVQGLSHQLGIKGPPTNQPDR